MESGARGGWPGQGKLLGAPAAGPCTRPAPGGPGLGCGRLAPASASSPHSSFLGVISLLRALLLDSGPTAQCDLTSATPTNRTTCWGSRWA